MVNVREWLLNNLISGVKKGIFAREYASILATNYLLRGLLTDEDIQRFIEETEPTPEPVEETVDTVDTAEETENSAETAESTAEETEDNTEEAE